MTSFLARAALAATVAMALSLSSCGEKEKQGSVAVSRPVVGGAELEVVRPAPREIAVEALGTVRSKTTASVAPQVMGRLTSVAVSEGAAVPAGAVLAVIEDTAVRAQLAAAEAAVAEGESARAEADAAVAQADAGKVLAEKTFERFRTLYEGKVVTRQEYEEAETRRTVAVKDLERTRQKKEQAGAKTARAKGEADAAKALLAWTRVTAPFAGVIVEKRADAGSMAVPGVPLFVLEDPSRHRIEASVSEAYLPGLKKGMPVTVLLDAEPGRPIPASISEIVPAVDPATRTFTLKADLPPGRFRSGQSGKVRFADGKRTILAIPKRAVTRAGGSDGVFTVGADDNVARLTVITLGADFGDRVEVLSGLTDGARVVLSPVDRMADGVRVEARR